MDDTFLDDDDERLSRVPDVGDNMKLYWTEDEEFYPATIASINDDEKYNIDYEDGDKETLETKNETWRFSSEEEFAASAHTAVVAQKEVTSS